MPAAVFAQHQLRLRYADVLWVHDLIGGALLEHAVLMDAGFVGESVLADDGLVALHLNAGDVRDEPAGRIQFLGIDVGRYPEVILPRPHSHDDLFERAVAGPLADAVDGAFDLARAFQDGGETVGHGHAEIVVTVNADDGLVDVADVFFQMGDGGRVLTGNGVADRVGDVDGRGAGVDGGL